MNEDRTKGNTIQDKMDDVYKTAFKARNEQVYIALRPVLSALKQAAIDRRAELTDEQIIEILRTEVKKRKDAMEQFKQGNRQDLVDQATNEIKQIEAFLPAQMSEEDIAKIVAEVKAATGAASPADMGKLMGAVMAKVKGKADGALVKKCVEAALK